MQLASVVHQYLVAFKANYMAQLLPSHRNAIGAMLRCRTPACGHMLLHCSQCSEQSWHPQSC